jgi:hypothetical protein
MATKKSIPIKEFKPCSNCPTPAKCKKAGKCMMKNNKNGY